MERLDNIGLLLTGIRGLMYLTAFIENNTIPNMVIQHGDGIDSLLKAYPEEFWQRYQKYFDHTKSVQHYLDTYNIDAITITDPDINSQNMKNTLLKRKEDYFVFSGGGIVQEGIFHTQKKFIHIHPGDLPQYKGSTCFYYSMLDLIPCGVSAFFMEKELDAGNIINHRSFTPPLILEEDWMFFDLVFDPWMRSQVLLDVIGSYKTKKTFEAKAQNTNDEEIYYVIHPALKHIAIENQIISK